MVLARIRQLQLYMTDFEIYYRKFDRNPQIHQVFIEIEITMERFFETL